MPTTHTSSSLLTLSRTMAPTPIERAGAALRIVTPLAWGLLAVAIVALVAGRLLGWVELTVLEPKTREGRSRVLELLGQRAPTAIGGFEGGRRERRELG